jgi:hypothetical protein
VESIAIYGQPKRDFDQLRRKVLKIFSGKFQSKSWHDALPQVDEAENPWGWPIAQWEEDLIPGLSRSELRGFPVVGQSCYGFFKQAGWVEEWQPAREFELPPGKELPKIYSKDHRFKNANSVRRKEVVEVCIALVTEWLNENIPSIADRPSLGEPPAFDVDQYIQLTNSPISRNSEWADTQTRRRHPRQERLFVYSRTTNSTYITHATL